MARRSDPGFQVIVSLQDRFTAPIKNINNSIALSTAKLRGLASVPGAVFKAAGFDKVGASIAGIGTSLGQVRSGITGLLGPFTQLAAAAGIFSMGKLVSDAVSAGGELIKLSTITGVAVDDLQKLRYAAEQSGIGADTFDGSLKKLNKSIVDALAGSKEQRAAFEAAGISMKDLATMNTADVFRRLADAVADSSSETSKHAIATTLLGKSGAELIPVLNEGATGIAKLGDELASTGAIMDQQTAEQGKAFGDIMTLMGAQARGLSYSILKELLPSITAIAKATIDWIAANKEWLTTKIVDSIRKLIEMGKAFAAIITEDIVPAVASMKPIWDGVVAVIGEGNAILLAFTSVVAPGVIGGLLGIVTGVGKLAAVLLANPFVAFIAAIAAAAYLIWKHWDDIVAAFGWARDQVNAAIDAIGLRAVFDAWGSIISGFVGVVRSLLGGDLQGVFDGVINILAGFGELFVAKFNFIFDAVDLLWSLLPAGIKSALNDVVTGILGMADTIGEALTGAFQSALDAVGELWMLLPADVRSFIQEIVDAITGMAGALWDALMSIFQGPIDAVKNLFSGLIEDIKNIPGKIGNFLVGGGEGETAPAAAVTAPAPAKPQIGQRRPGVLGSGPVAVEGPGALGKAVPPAAAGPGALGAVANENTSKIEGRITVAAEPGSQVTDVQSNGDADVDFDRQKAGMRNATPGNY